MVPTVVWIITTPFAYCCFYKDESSVQGWFTIQFFPCFGPIMSCINLIQNFDKEEYKKGNITKIYLFIFGSLQLIFFDIG